MAAEVRAVQISADVRLGQDWLPSLAAYVLAFDCAVCDAERPLRLGRSGTGGPVP